jgi:DNA uptake protein ComE-like DNA-binding protein
MRRLVMTLMFGALLALTPSLIQNSYAQTPAPKAAAATAAKKEAPKEAPKSALIDINRASAKDLDALPGIGEARSKAIIAGRPYKAKNELTQRKIIPQNVYDGIKDKIIAHQM